MKVIAFDYDETWSLDPKLFRATARMFRASGWKTIIVTARIPEDPITCQTTDCVDIYYAGDLYKDDYMKKQGINVDIWVDDCPEFCRRKFGKVEWP